MGDSDFRTLEDLKGSFRNFESENSLFDWMVQGFSVWENIRVDIYKQILSESQLDKSDEGGGDRTFREIIQILFLIIRNVVYKNPFFSTSSSVVFFGHRRRKLDEEENTEDIYCDPVIDNLNLSYLYFEEPYDLRHVPPKAENVRHLDICVFLPKLLYKFFGRFYSLEEEEVSKAESLEQKLMKRYNVGLELKEMIKKELFERSIQLRLYKMILKRVSPDLAVFVVGYGREVQIEACKSLDIPVVELQHGVIDQYHMGYDLPEGKSTFPDYLFTFGEYWRDVADYPVPEENIVPAGYPYFNRESSKYSDVESENKIIFISQETIGRELSKLAANLAEKDRTYDIIYKLHPIEYNSWKEDYPWLIDANLEVIDNNQTSLYRLLAESNTQVGVYSTAIYEGLAMGLETFIVELPGSERMDRLVSDSHAKKASNADEIYNKVSLESEEGCKYYFFRENSIDKVIKEINRIVED